MSRALDSRFHGNDGAGRSARCSVTPTKPVLAQATRAPRLLAQQPDAVAASDADPADRARGIRSTADTTDTADATRSSDTADTADATRSSDTTDTADATRSSGTTDAANTANRARGIRARANPADRSGGIRSSSHDATSYFVLFRGQRLHELLHYFGSNLGALHQLAAGIHNGLAEVGNP